MASKKVLLNIRTKDEALRESVAPQEEEMRITEAQVGLQPLISEQTIQVETSLML
jgi:hypothetical protein